MINQQYVLYRTSRKLVKYQDFLNDLEDNPKGFLGTEFVLYNIVMDDVSINSQENTLFFNYFNEEYETKIAEDNKLEKDLPDIYTFNDKNYSVITDKLKKILTFDQDVLDITGNYSSISKKTLSLSDNFPYLFKVTINNNKTDTFVATSESVRIKENIKKSYNLLLEKYVKNTLNFNSLTNFNVLNIENIRLQNDDVTKLQLFSSALSNSLKTKFNNQISTEKKSFEDVKRALDNILNNISFLNTKIGIVIRKYDPSNNLIKTFYIKDELGTIEFNDTQLLYGKKYKYVVTPIFYTAGIPFSLAKFIDITRVPRTSITQAETVSSIDGNRPDTNPVIPSNNINNSETVSVRTNQFFMSLDNTKFQSSLISPIQSANEFDVMVQTPVPVYPNVSFSTKTDRKNKVDIVLSPFYTKEDDKARLHKLLIRSFREDIITFNSIRSSFGDLFKIDGYDLNLIKNYETYRLDFYPNSYDDFKTNISKAIVVDKNISSFTLSDTVEFDKKYYYTFRTINKKGVPSPFSEIYELQLIEDNGIKKLYINVVELKNNIGLTSDNKSFKRFLKITPQDEQVRVSKQTSRVYKAEFVDNNNDLYNKTYILKVVSKKTGRIIEYKLKFTREGLVSPQQSTQQNIRSIVSSSSPKDPKLPSVNKTN
jgi:hypothetical protein